MSLLRRKQGMWELQEMGYHTGTGFLVGTPYQTIENVSEDLLFYEAVYATDDTDRTIFGSKTYAI